MIDIHSHILPFLDDGAKSEEQAMIMLEIAKSEGITSIIATPHYHGLKKSAFSEKVQESVEQLQEKLLARDINITLYPGNEIYYFQDVEKELADGQVNIPRCAIFIKHTVLHLLKLEKPCFRRFCPLELQI